MPPEVLAYYSMLTNQIVMYEDKQLGDAVPELAAKQACYTIAHEGVHQLLTNIGVQKRLAHWPAWICEGLPEYYCPLKVNSTLVHSTNSDLPVRTLKWTKAGMVNDIRMWSLLQMHEASGKALETLIESPKSTPMATHSPGDWSTTSPRKSPPHSATTSPISASTNRSTPPIAHTSANPTPLRQTLRQRLCRARKRPAAVSHQFRNAKGLPRPIENQTHYLVKSVEKQGHGHAIKYAITTSPDAAKKWKEQEEATNKKASFFTIVCKTRGEAERQIQKMQQH